MAQFLTEFDKHWYDGFQCLFMHFDSSFVSAVASVHDERAVCLCVCVCVLDECHLPIDPVAQRPIVSLVNGALLHSRLGSCSGDDSNSLEPTVRLGPTPPTSAIYEG